MATVFNNLPVPAGDGVGIGVDVGAMGGVRTVSVQGTFTGTVTVEVSNDGGTTYVPLSSFTDPKQRTFNIAAHYMRVRRSGVVAPAGTPNVDVGADDIGSRFANLPVTAGDGSGAAVDVSALGTFNSVAVTGTFTGSVVIQISLDNVVWLPLMGFTASEVQSKRFVAQYMRVMRAGVGAPAGLPVVNVAAADDPIGSSGIGLDRTIIVAKVGGDANTIEAGLAAASALVPAPSLAAPANVWVFPGVYAENPMTIPVGVSVWGQNITSTIVTAVTATSPVFTIGNGSTIQQLSILDANGVGGIGVLATGASGEAMAVMVQAQDCTTAFVATGGISLTCGFTRAVRVSSAMAGYHAVAGSTIDAFNSQAHGVSAAARITRGFHADGAGSVVHVFGCDVHFCGSAYYASSTGDVHATSGHSAGCDYGFHIAATGGTIHATGVDQEDNATYDLYIEAANGTFRGSGCTIRSDRISVAVGASIVSTQLSDVVGNYANMVIGELAVGLPLFPSATAGGEGNSHVRLMTILRNVNLEIGAWTDITTEMASASGSTANAFAGVGIGQCFYAGGLEKEFPGLKIKTTAAIVLGTGSLAWEFWNGAAWTAFYLMAADSVAPYDSHAQDVFGRVAFEQVRFNADEFTGWATKALNGITRYWIRARQVAAITTSPTLEQVQLQTNHTNTNLDGVVEHFGTAILQRIIPWHQRWTDDLSGASPTNGALSLVNGVTLTPIDNRFNDNALDGFGGIQTIPIGLDTSRPVTITWGWISKANGAPSVVEFQSRFGLIRIGDTLDGTVASMLQAQNVTVGVADINILKENSFTLRPYLAVPGNKGNWSLFRDATGGTPDTLAASIDIVDVRFNGYFWR